MQDEWLDEPGHLDAWEGQPEAVLKLDAKTRRILITHWVGEAWERLTTLPQYNLTFRKCFMRTGALITADGSDDHEIQPMVGLAGGYKVPELVEIDDDHPAPELELDPVAPDIEPELQEEQEEVEEFDNDADIVGDPHAVEANNAGDAAIADAEEHPEPDPTVDPVAQDEQESWDAAVLLANALDPPLCPVRDDDARIPARLTGRYVFIMLDGEWDCAKVDSSASIKQYRYRLEASRVYGYADFDKDIHGRYGEVNNSQCRWVLLQ